MSLRRIGIGNPTPRRVTASSVVRLDVPDRREAGVIGGRRAAMVAPSAGVSRASATSRRVPGGRGQAPTRRRTPRAVDDQGYQAMR